MPRNVHLRFLGVFQPGPQVRQKFPNLHPRSRVPGFNRFPQAHDHFPNGPKLLRDGSTLFVKHAPFFFCSDQNHANLCLL